MAFRSVIGIDENGLGPRMGPLVVTGVRLRLDGRGPTLEELRRATGLDDSKRVFSPAHRDRGEARALGVLGPRSATSLPALLRRLSVPPPWPAPPACPEPERARSGSCPALDPGRPLPRWIAAPDDLAAPLAQLGVQVERIATAAVCPGVLNEALRAESSKLQVDLQLFETVGAALLDGAGTPPELVCGKVGGTERYAARFRAWGRRPMRTIGESRACSTYEIEGVGRVSFVRDADATEPAVAIASVIGKYVRELWMDDLAASVGWTEATPSGYHDERTARLLRHVRDRIAAGTSPLPAGCVERLR